MVSSPFVNLSSNGNPFLVVEFAACASHSIRGDVIGQLPCASERHGVFWCFSTHRQSFHQRKSEGSFAWDVWLRIDHCPSVFAVWCFVLRGQSNIIFPWHYERRRPFFVHFECWTFPSLSQLRSQRPSSRVWPEITLIHDHLSTVVSSFSLLLLASGQEIHSAFRWLS